MKAVQTGSYMKSSEIAGGAGQRVFRYEVQGTKAELDAYKQAQGKHYRETNDGRNVPLFFSIRSVGNTATLGISRSGKVFADNTELANLESLSEQYPALAGEISKQIAGILFAKTAVTQVSAPVTAGADLK